MPFIITPYYCIIGGWVTKYAAAYLIDGPRGAWPTAATSSPGFITSDTESFLWMLLFMAIVFTVVSLGVKGGIEKANLVMMPALIVMAVAIAAYTLMQPGAAEGALYYLVPDFSKFSPELVIGALGQMFYSLSLAMGIMVTYGSYLDKSAKSEPPRRASRASAGYDLRRVAPRRPHDRPRRRSPPWAPATPWPGAPAPSLMFIIAAAECSRDMGLTRPSVAGLRVLPPGAVRGAHQRHLARGDLRVHHPGRCAAASAVKQRCSARSSASPRSRASS